MVNKYNPGDIAFIVESTRFIREVEIVKATGEFCLVRFTDGCGGIKVRSSKLFPSREDAQNTLPWDGIRKWHPD